MMNTEIIKRNPLIIGICIILAMYVIGDVISGVSFLLPSFLFAGIVVGFMVNNNMKTGAINSAILGLISSILVNAVLISMMFLQGYGHYFTMLFLFYIVNIIIQIVISTVGGVLGSLIQTEKLENLKEQDSS